MVLTCASNCPGQAGGVPGQLAVSVGRGAVPVCSRASPQLRCAVLCLVIANRRGIVPLPVGACMSGSNVPCSLPPGHGGFPRGFPSPPPAAMGLRPGGGVSPPVLDAGLLTPRTPQSALGILSPSSWRLCATGCSTDDLSSPADERMAPGSETGSVPVSPPADRPQIAAVLRRLYCAVDIIVVMPSTLRRRQRIAGLAVEAGSTA